MSEKARDWNEEICKHRFFLIICVMCAVKTLLSRSHTLSLSSHNVTLPLGRIQCYKFDLDPAEPQK